MKELFRFHDEIAEAIKDNQPVVALESTVISHGLPFPTNVETAFMLEDAVRNAGAIPATICIKDGTIRVGLSRRELEEFAAKTSDVKKISTRDLGIALSKKITGATTVSSTIRIAHMAGIKVFATGGLGGVHRDGHNSFDISADLVELANTSIVVVCAGAKSILDIPRTLEYLETFRVPVIGFGVDEFPTFYSRGNGHALEWRLNHPQEIAQLFSIHAQTSNTAVVVAQPIPVDHEIEEQQVEVWIERALREALHNNIVGKNTTPFLLKKLFEFSEGKTLQANIALLKNNARLASEIGVGIQHTIPNSNLKLKVKHQQELKSVQK